MQIHRELFLLTVSAFRKSACVLEHQHRLHSVDEQRFAITGLSYQRRLLVVVHVDRGDRIRIISARLATPLEREQYESGAE